MPMAAAQGLDGRNADRVLAAALRARRGPVLATAVTGLVAAAGGLLLPAVTGRALDAALSDPDALLPAVGTLAVLLAVVAAADVVGQQTATAGGAGATAWVRHRMLRTLLGLGLAGQRTYPAGDAVARITAGASSTGLVLPLVLSAVTTALTTVVALVALLLLDWTLPVTLLAGLLLAAVLLRPFTGKATTAFADYQEAQGAVAARLVDALAGLRTIRASGTAGLEVDRVLRPLPALRAAGLRTWALQQRLAWAFGLLVRVLQLAVIAVAGWGVSTGRLSPGELVAAIGYAGIALGAIEQVDDLVELTQVRAGARRIAELAAPEPELPRAGWLAPGPGEVELREVTVRLDGRTVLDGCSLHVAAGSTFAIVGPSGAGKSVLVGLLGRLYEPDTGDVLVDGSPVGGLADAELRAAVAYGFDRPALLGRTVADAVAYALPEGVRDRDRRVAAAAAAAHADGFAARLPQRYDTPLDETPMSGGEQQRLGLARAVAQRARVLVLDDATSSLDTATEAEVTEALASVLPGRTRIVVAHRVRTAAAADQVAWLADGRVRAVAPHRVLWAQPEYRALFAAGAT